MDSGLRANAGSGFADWRAGPWRRRPTTERGTGGAFEGSGTYRGLPQCRASARCAGDALPGCWLVLQPAVRRVQAMWAACSRVQQPLSGALSAGSVSGSSLHSFPSPPPNTAWIVGAERAVEGGDPVI
ncbi:hypothetical protein NDU88_006070 [Pleurodeles waltl]|uniref:Uncharacterized protein n=1 Tax=Pleurodeles waltl TaxID=8319 RepID=A0AAV7N083_PLEWA|nr:hypothetical protein NDU88_006070 [Pleurodeles waltl]